jgi:hypothetical protein
MSTPDNPESGYCSTPEETAEDMLVNSELRIGGQVGVGSPAGLAYMRERGWVGPSGCLSARGLTEARRAYTKYWGDR